MSSFQHDHEIGNGKTVFARTLKKSRGKLVLISRNHAKLKLPSDVFPLAKKHLAH